MKPEQVVIEFFIVVSSGLFVYYIIKYIDRLTRRKARGGDRKGSRKPRKLSKNQPNRPGRVRH